MIQSIFPIRLSFLRFYSRRAKNSFQFSRGFTGLARVGFVHDYSIFSCRNGRFPGFRLFLFLLSRYFLALGPRYVEEAA